MSLARQHRDRTLAKLSAAVAPFEVDGQTLPVVAGPVATATAQMALRLTHDRRRLKEIQSIERKIDAKREMLPEYEAWVQGILAAAAGETIAATDGVVPTIMVWKIDTGDYQGAIKIADFVLRNHIPLPDHYQRQAATLIVEEISDAALRELTADKPFALDVLEEVDLLTEESDMPDEVRAKLFKAIGLERARQLDTDAPAAEAQEQALAALRRAQQLNDRVGVKDSIRKIERAMAKAAKETAPPPAPQDNAGAAG